MQNKSIKNINRVIINLCAILKNTLMSRLTDEELGLIVGSIQSAQSFNKALSLLDTQARTQVFSAMKSKLPDLMRSATDLQCVLEPLCDEEKSEILMTAGGCRLLHTSDDWVLVLQENRSLIDDPAVAKMLLASSLLKEIMDVLALEHDRFLGSMKRVLQHRMDSLLSSLDGFMDSKEVRKIQTMIDTLTSVENINTARIELEEAEIKMKGYLLLERGVVPMDAVFSKDRQSRNAVIRVLSDVARSIMSLTTPSDSLVYNYLYQLQDGLIDRINAAITGVEFYALHHELKKLHQSLSSPEIQAVLEVIHGYQRENKLFSRRNHKAAEIERALVHMDPFLRGTVISGERNAVQDALAKGRFGGKATTCLAELKARFSSGITEAGIDDHGKYHHSYTQLKR